MKFEISARDGLDRDAILRLTGRFTEAMIDETTRSTPDRPASPTQAKPLEVVA